jgi:hypothetical protein
MGQARRYGQMAPNMKANGSLTKQMERESSGMQTATSMKATGRTTRLMDLASIFT